MPKKLTDEEIIKALECCCIEHDCSKCTYSKNNSAGCINDIMKDILDLINRLQARVEKSENIERFADKTIATQQAEIESLKAENSNLTSDLTSLQKDLTSSKAEVEVSQRRIATLEKLAEYRKKAVFERVERNLELRKALKTAKAEAYKECIEKVKKESFKINYCGSVYNVVDVDDLDNLFNELVGDENE